MGTRLACRCEELALCALQRGGRPRGCAALASDALVVPEHGIGRHADDVATPVAHATPLPVHIILARSCSTSSCTARAINSGLFERTTFSEWGERLDEFRRTQWHLVARAEWAMCAEEGALGLIENSTLCGRNGLHCSTIATSHAIHAHAFDTGNSAHRQHVKESTGDTHTATNAAEHFFSPQPYTRLTSFAYLQRQRQQQAL